ncbi:hypothetical protein [Pseudalkalibacillus berkeleyi]|uniref:SdpI/YhfL family protein n=1 Tax=Pseudalkalibacillus berkeleyi TaxID=1069813 RepID=A0ABS9GY80_9BACL|nr:hypothetical protein [Pseudalkalibacillus berkeleyi]MCF6136589.1 hypothetical protein [Pseudalkalibacillus berkeleyi]
MLILELISNPAFIITLIIVTIISSIQTYRYKNREKIDEGFSLIYYKLSYRRKLKRSIWTNSIIALLFTITALTLDMDLTSFLLILFLIFLLSSVEIAYNYRMWRRKEQ